eukprot:232323-Rhodomonas_salina.6
MQVLTSRSRVGSSTMRTGSSAVCASVGRVHPSSLSQTSRSSSPSSITSVPFPSDPVSIALFSYGACAYVQMPDFLMNGNRLNLGVRKKTGKEGLQVSDVELPPWAQGSAEEFVRKMRQVATPVAISDRNCDLPCAVWC